MEQRLPVSAQDLNAQAPAPLGPADLVSARGAVAVQLATDASESTVPTVLYSKGASMSCHPASLTKLMTALLAVERCGDLQTPITVDAKDLRPGSGNHHVPGDVMSLHAALHSLLIPSSNTAAEAIARSVGTAAGSADSSQQFLQAMNVRATELGMLGSRFTNPSGLHDPDMISTACDTVILLGEVAKHPSLIDILGKRHAHIEITGQRPRVEPVKTTVRTLDRQTVLGGKTGTRGRNPAQYNLAILVQGAGAPIAIALMASSDRAAREEDADAVIRHLNSGRPNEGTPARTSVSRVLTAEDLAGVVDGVWLRSPAPDWSLQRLLRPRAAVRSRRPPRNALLPVRNPNRSLRNLQESRLDDDSVALLTEDEALGSASRFPVLRVGERDEALSAIAKHYRDGYSGTMIAVTGSVGKTTTTSLLGTVLSGRLHTYFSRRDGNGLPSLREHCVALGEETHAVIEVARIALPVAADLLSPDVAVVTSIAEAHLQDLGSLEAVARVKGQLFSGLDVGGTAIYNRDTPHQEILRASAKQHAGRILTYGRHPESDVRLVRYTRTTNTVSVDLLGRPVEYQLLAHGIHNVMNSMAALCVIEAIGEDVSRFTDFFKHFQPATGRGTVHELDVAGRHVTLIDHSHNANPASMAAALGDFAAQHEGRRRVLVLGDMLELGPNEASLHTDLLSSVLCADPSAVYLVGSLMANLSTHLPDTIRAAHVSSVEQLEALLAIDLKDGDALLVKGSRDTGLEQFTTRFREQGKSAESDQPLSWRVTISGPAVQGVGYRQWVKQHAVKLGVHGWVRNRSDGKVDALISGDQTRLERLHGLLPAGPRKADVNRVLVRRVSTVPRPGFRIRSERSVEESSEKP